MTDVLRLLGMTFHTTPAEATMMGGCDFASENGGTVDAAAFLDAFGADGKIGQGKTMALAPRVMSYALR